MPRSRVHENGQRIVPAKHAEDVTKLRLADVLPPGHMEPFQETLDERVQRHSLIITYMMQFVLQYTLWMHEEQIPMHAITVNFLKNVLFCITRGDKDQQDESKVKDQEKLHYLPLLKKFMAAAGAWHPPPELPSRNGVSKAIMQYTVQRIVTSMDNNVYLHFYSRHMRYLQCLVLCHDSSFVTCLPQATVVSKPTTAVKDMTPDVREVTVDFRARTKVLRSIPVSEWAVLQDAILLLDDASLDALHQSTPTLQAWCVRRACDLDALVQTERVLVAAVLHGKPCPTSMANSSTETAAPSTAKAAPTIAKAAPTIAEATPTIAKATPSIANATPSTPKAVPSTPKAVPSTATAASSIAKNESSNISVKPKRTKAAKRASLVDFDKYLDQHWWSFLSLMIHMADTLKSNHWRPFAILPQQKGHIPCSMPLHHESLSHMFAEILAPIRDNNQTDGAMTGETSAVEPMTDEKQSVASEAQKRELRRLQRRLDSMPFPRARPDPFFLEVCDFTDRRSTTTSG